MNREEQAAYVTGIRRLGNRIADAGLMRRLTYGSPGPGVAEEDVERVIAALERAARRHFREGSTTLAKKVRRWVKAGCRTKGRSARRLREAPGGGIAFKALQRAPR